MRFYVRVLLLFLTTSLCARQQAPLPLRLKPVLEQQLTSEALSQEEVVDSLQLHTFREKVLKVFPKDKVLTDSTLSSFTNLLYEAREHHAYIDALFEIYGGSLYPLKPGDTTSIEGDSLLQRTFVERWTQLCLQEKNAEIKQLLSNYFEDRLLYGSSVIVSLDNDQEMSVGDQVSLRVNTNPYYINHLGINEIILEEQVERLHFKSPFKATGFRTVSKEKCRFTKEKYRRRRVFDKPGIYRLSYHNKTFYQEFYLLVSDLRPEMRRDNHNLYLQMKTGKGYCKNFSYLYKRGDSLHRVHTVDGAIARFPLADTGRTSYDILCEYNGHYGRFNVTDSPKASITTSAYLYSDRPLYRPGDTLFFGGVIRDFVEAIELQKGSVDSVKVVVRDRKRTILKEVWCQVNSWGHFNGLYEIPSTFEPGYIGLVLSDGNYTHSFVDTESSKLSVQVKKYEKAAAKLQLISDKKHYVAGDTLRLDVQAHYLFGIPFRGNSVNISLYNNQNFTKTITQNLDSTGQLRLAISLDSLQEKPLSDGLLKLSVSVPFDKKYALMKELTLQYGEQNTSQSEESSSDRLSDTITPHKDLYQFGDTVQMRVLLKKKANEVGFYLEGGSLTHASHYSGIPRNEFAIQFVLQREMGYNVILRVEAGKYRTFSQSISVDPDYFITPLMVAVDSQFRPGDTCNSTIALTDRNGNPLEAEISLMVVDEAIYELRADNDKKISILIPDEFESQLDSITGLDTLSVQECIQYFRDYSIYPLGQHIQSGHRQKAKWDFYGKKLRFGGGCGFGGGAGGVSLHGLSGNDMSRSATLRSLKRRYIPVRDNFRDVAYHDFSIITDSSGKADVAFPLPDNLTTWRMTFRGSDGKDHLVQHKEWFQTSLPFMVRVLAPKFLMQGDSTHVTLAISNFTDTLLKGEGDFVVGTKEASNSIVDSLFTFTIQPGFTTYLDIPVNADAKDSLYLKAVVDAASHTDGEKIVIPIITMDQKQRGFYRGRLSGDLFEDTIAVTFPKEAYEDTRQLSVYVEDDGGAFILPALEYMMRYPHGCVEQTMSRFLPAIAASRLVLPSDTCNLLSRFDSITQKSLDKLEGYQHSDGLWGWWKNDSSHAKMTALVLDGLAFLIESNAAERHKIRAREFYKRAIPETLNKLKDTTWCGKNRLALLYGLRLHEDKSLIQSALKELYSKHKSLSLVDRALLAELLLMHGENFQAKRMARKIKKSALEDSSGTFWLFDSTTSEEHYLDRNIALLTARNFRLLHKISSREEVAPIADWFFDKYDGEKWVNTFTSTEVIRALAPYFTPDMLEATMKRPQVMMEGVSIFDSVHTKDAMVLSFSVDSTYPDTLLFTAQKSDREMRWSVSTKYIAPYKRGVDSTARGVLRKTMDVDASYLSEKIHRWQEKFVSGRVVTVSLVFENDEPLDYLMMEDHTPAGAKIIGYDTPSAANHVEESGGKIFFYFENLPAGIHRFSYKMRLRHEGRYTVAPARAELMYEPHIQWETGPTVMEIE